MATVTPPYADPGRASYEVLDTYTQNFLLAGHHPELKPAFSFPLDNDTSFDQFSVVGLDASGNLALATATGTDDIEPIGVLAHAASLGATGEAHGQVWYSGAFNMEALVWDASFSEAEKLAAFRGAPTPTTIIIAKRGE